MHVSHFIIVQLQIGRIRNYLYYKFQIVFNHMLITHTKTVMDKH